MHMFRQLGAVVALGTLCGVASAENITPNLKFNGFATVSAAVVDDPQGGVYKEDFFGYGGIGEDPDFGLESLIGLQFDYRISEKTNLVTQLTAEGRDYYQVKAHWGYLSHELNDSLLVRAGRFALPSFMYNETIQVGQSYPWVRVPVEVYSGVPISNFDGVDLLYRKPLGDWDFNAQVYTGSAKNDLFTASGANGLNLSLSSDNLTVRTAVMTANITLPVTGLAPLDLNEEKVSFASLGVLYDDGKWFAAGELSHSELNSWMPDSNSGYVSVGHYIGKWLPYVLASKINSYNADECTANPVCGGGLGVSLQPYAYKEQTTYALGARYAYSSNVSLKVQVDHVHDFNGTSGYLTNGPVIPDLTAPPLVSTPPDSFNVFTVSLTSSF